MARNPIEDNFVTKYVLGFAELFTMMIGGGAVGRTFLSIGIPYGNWLGVAVGASLVFAVFTVLYRRYDASYTTEQ